MTSRIAAIDPRQAQGKTHEILNAVEKMLGVKPNLFRVAAQSPAALEGLVALNGATAHGSLNAKARAAIALTVAETNGCDYCLSAHTVLGRVAGMSDDDMDRARDAASNDQKTAAILRFARAIVTEHGRVPEAELNMLRRAGGTDGEAIEIIANVVLNIFTNYINLVAQTEIDFPIVRSRSK